MISRWRSKKTVYWRTLLRASPCFTGVVRGGNTFLNTVSCRYIFCRFTGFSKFNSGEGNGWIPPVKRAHCAGNFRRCESRFPAKRGRNTMRKYADASLNCSVSKMRNTLRLMFLSVLKSIFPASSAASRCFCPALLNLRAHTSWLLLTISSGICCRANMVFWNRHRSFRRLTRIL